MNAYIRFKLGLTEDNPTIKPYDEKLWAEMADTKNLPINISITILFAVGGRADSQLGVKIAAAVLLALPVMIAFLFFQKHFIQSMASTGMKD
jgi:ABC-type glycerol-3-phosphate transport system permease component